MGLPTVRARPSVEPWPPLLVVRGPGFRGKFHSHHSLHFVLAMDGELLVRSSTTGPWSRAAGVLTAPDAPHAIDCHGVEVVLVFLDPQSEAGATLHAALTPAVRRLSGAERSALLRDVVPRTSRRSGAAEWVRTAARTLQLPLAPARRAIHPSVRKLVGLLHASGVDEETSLEKLARAVGLSPSRLMHVFTSSMGIPLRPYLSWLRVQRAAGAIVNGDSLTEAAHAAGFSDAAHMSRTFRRMLGTRPSELRRFTCSPWGARQVQGPKDDASDG